MCPGQILWMKIELKKWETNDTKALAQICSETDRHFLSDRLPDPYTEADAEHWISFILIYAG